MQRKSYYDGKTNKGRLLFISKDNKKNVDGPDARIELNVGGVVYEVPLWFNETNWGDKTIAIDLDKWRPLLSAIVQLMLDTTPKGGNTSPRSTQDVVPGKRTDDTTEEFGF